MNNGFRTFLKFNMVGVIGIPVQLSVLALLKSGLGIHYLIATALAVETAVLHNFTWHERWTWAERTKAAPSGLLGRLVRFHLSNGLITICGNLSVMWVLVSRLHVSYLIANVFAMGVCAIANFVASDRLVFQKNALPALLLLLPGPALYEDSAADALVRSATQSTYMLRLTDARAATHELQRRYPDHPAGFLIEAETYWWEAQEDPGNTKIEESYYHAQQVAQEKAEQALQAARYYKPELLAYLASAYGSYARFQVTQKNAYLGALRAGLKAHDYAVQTYALDKNYYDVFVGLGAYNYFTGTLPPMIKPFAWLIGATGDKNLGVSQLQTAIEKARYSGTQARIVYYSALLSNKEYASAFPILERLIADYPDNFVLYDWAEVWFREQKKLSEGIEYFERAYAKQAGRSPLMAQYMLLDKGDMQLGASRKADVIQTLQRIRAIPHSDTLLSKKVDALEKAAKK
jgi:putative flippase GtrA